MPESGRIGQDFSKVIETRCNHFIGFLCAIGDWHQIGMALFDLNFGLLVFFNGCARSFIIHKNRYRNKSYFPNFSKR